MTDGLIQEMSARLGRSETEVEKALGAFASAVQDRLRSEGRVHLAGLGTLHKQGTDTRFDPSEALVQAVNYRWLSPGAPVATTSDAVEAADTGSQEPDPALSAGPALAAEAGEVKAGLAEIPETESSDSTDILPDSAAAELSPEPLEDPLMSDDQKPIRKVSWAPIDEVDPTDLGSSSPSRPSTGGNRPSAGGTGTSAGGTGTSAGSTPATRPATPAASPPPVTPPPPAAPSVVPKPSMPNPVVHPPATTSAPIGAPETDSIPDLTYESLHNAGAATAGGTAVGSAAASRSRPPQRGGRARSTATEPASRNRLFAILAFLAIVVVAAILWTQMRGGVDEPGLGATETESVEGIVSEGGEGPSGTESPEGPESTPATTPPTDSGATTPPDTGTPSTAPPTASAIDPNSSGYTLIVGSSLSRAGANSEVARYSNLGHPVAVLTYPDGDGRTRHRIAVGEFESAGDADSARRAMASRLPDGTWVRRIRR